MNDILMSWFTRLINAATFDIIIPASILMGIGLLLLYVLFMAQRRPDFDIAAFLRDDQGHYSAARCWGFVALGIHSWIMATLTFQKLLIPEYVTTFAFVWSGVPVALEIAKRWTGNLPFAQAGTGPVQQVTMPSPGSTIAQQNNNDPPPGQ